MLQKLKPMSRRARSPRPIPLRDITERDLKTLTFIRRYKLIDAPHLKMLLGGANIRALSTRLREMCYAHLLLKWEPQWSFYNANYRSIIYGIDDAGDKLLSAHNIHDDEVANFPHVFNEFAHNFMLSNVIAHIEAGGNLTGVKLTPYPGKLEVKVTVADTDGKPYTKPYSPDFAFKLTYPDGKELRFLMEIDCGTEPLKTQNFTRSNYNKKFLQLKEILTNELLNDYGFKPPIRVLHVTTTEDRMKNLMALAGPSKSNFFKVHPKLGQYVIEEDGHWTPQEPPADLSIFTTPWLSNGYDPFQM